MDGDGHISLKGCYMSGNKAVADAWSEFCGGYGCTSTDYRNQNGTITGTLNKADTATILKVLYDTDEMAMPRKVAAARHFF